MTNLIIILFAGIEQQPYSYLVLGMLAYILIDITAFKKSVPAMSNITVLSQYFSINLFAILSGVVMGIAIIGLMITGNLPEFLFDPLQAVGLDVNKMPGSAFLIGLLNQWVLIKIRKIINSVQAESVNDRIITRKEGLK